MSKKQKQIFKRQLLHDLLDDRRPESLAGFLEPRPFLGTSIGIPAPAHSLFQLILVEPYEKSLIIQERAVKEA